MNRIVKLGAIYPAELNLNGDQGNLLVLRKQLEWSGLQVEVLSLDQSVQDWPDDLDFLLVGHGSRAAWHHVWPDFSSRQYWLKTNIARGLVGLGVGSGQEVFYPRSSVNEFGLGLIYRELMSMDRQSRFRLGTLDGVEVLGYLNRDTDAPTIERLGSMILTGLHGPVLAKNETLLQVIISEIARNANCELSGEDSMESKQRASRAVAQVWSLEEGLARE